MSPSTLILLLVAATAVPLAAQQDKDPETSALRDEMQRSIKDLHLDQSERPYYIAYKITDSTTREAAASFGALTSSGENRSRTLSVVVRVGSYDFDNSNAPAGGNMLANILGAIASSATPLPLDDNYEELRRKLWLATDAAYKKAIEDLSAKKAARQARSETESVPDFSKEPARQESEVLPPIDLPLATLEHLVREASATFRSLPLVETSGAQMTVTNAAEHFLNSEGTAFVRQVPDVYFRSSAAIQNAQGETFNDSYSVTAHSFAEFPAEPKLVSESQSVADGLTLRRKGHAAKRYNGPVLIEGEAAAEIFAHSFATLLSSHPRSNSGGGLGSLLNGPTASLLNKVGSRVLPDFLSVTNNPRITQLDDHPLHGSYKFDEEGVPAQEVLLVKDGVLKTLLSSRAPVRGILQSTGSDREHGVLPGNLLVTAAKSIPQDALKQQLIDLIKTRGLEFGILIRRLAGNTALVCLRIYPDGHEESLRDARVAEITAATFKDVLAVSNERTFYTERAASGGLANFAPSSGSDLVTYVVPDMLFEDMLVEHIANEHPLPPATPNPIAAN